MKVLSIFATFFLFTQAVSQDVAVTNLRCEMLAEPQGIDITTPRLSWEISGKERNVFQSAYQLIIASNEEKLSKDIGDLWDSGKRNSAQSINVSYEGADLKSKKDYFWKVRIWTGNGAANSKPAHFSTGMLAKSDWKAKWIGLDRAFAWDSVSKFARLSARYFRKQANLNKSVKKATAYISGLGLYEFFVNGEKIGDQVLAPVPTDYSKSVLYNTFDITDKLKRGENALAATLGNGRFFAMRQNYKPQKWHTFGFPKMLLQVEISFVDGTSETIVSDGSWKVTADGPIRTNNEYDGEEYDANREMPGWNKPGYNDSRWLKAELVKAPGGVVKAQMTANMKVMESLPPVSIKRLASGVSIIDMGQNMAGWLKMNVSGKKGDTVTLRFAESLQPDGSLYMANLRDAIVTDKYILKGSGLETWSPSFVFHGFRYVEVSGIDGALKTADFTGEVIYDDMITSGSFASSNELLNSIHKNAYWGIRGNYKGMPIDCPQRNERQPWLGDRATGAYGESFIFNNGNLYAKWLDDIQDAQTPEGSIPDVAPSFWFYYKDNMTWPGTYLMVAKMLYTQFGDKQAIIKHYPSMKKWLGYMKGKYMKNGVISKDSYGDWCVPPESPELIHSRDSSRTTDPSLLATAYYCYMLQLMEEFSEIAGKNDDRLAFKKEELEIKNRFNQVFYHPTTHSYGNNTVTANILPLAFRLVPDGDSTSVFNGLVKRITEQDNSHISTGVIGTQWLMRWLTNYGRADLAYKIAANKSYPGWGYMIENGATTIWELWNGNTANPSMNSQNHVMLLGDLMIWYYENLAGIKSDPAHPGFENIIMKPAFNSGLTSVNASYQSVRGKISSSWEIKNGTLNWQIIIPGNTKARIWLPAKNEALVAEGGRTISSSTGARYIGKDRDGACFELGSGQYNFQTEIDFKQLAKAN